VADGVKLTTNERLDVGLFLAISAALVFAALVVESDTGARLLVAATGLVPFALAVVVVRQRQSGKPRVNRWDARTREQKLIGLAINAAILVPVWFLGPTRHPDLLFVTAFGVAAGCAFLVAEAVVQRWPAGGVRSLLKPRRP
jgi:hypothetical protein